MRFWWAKHGVSPRLARAFIRREVVSLRALTRLTERDFVMTPGVGRVTLYEVRELLSRNGLTFKSTTHSV